MFREMEFRTGNQWLVGWHNQVPKVAHDCLLMHLNAAVALAVERCSRTHNLDFRNHRK